jgi:hypothetical protein
VVTTAMFAAEALDLSSVTELGVTVQVGAGAPLQLSSTVWLNPFTEEDADDIIRCLPGRHGYRSLRRSSDCEILHRPRQTYHLGAI